MSAVHGKTVLITGARGGIGRALLDAFLAAGAARVIAADRTLQSGHGDARVEPAALDLTIAEGPGSAAAAAARYADVDILVNNAGVNTNTGIFDDADGTHARREIEVNYLGTLGVLRAFAPLMRQRRHGTIVNLLSTVALANIPSMGSYSASKAAVYSLTQAARAELAGFGVRVVGMFPGPVDTVMTAHLPIPKISPQQVAQALIDGLDEGLDEVFPFGAKEFHARFVADHKAVERENASKLPGSTRRLLAGEA